MTKKQPSLDGFIPRRTDGISHGQKGLQPSGEAPIRQSTYADDATHIRQQQAGGLTRQELDESLNSIDEGKQQTQKVRKKRRSIKKIIKRTAVVLIIIALCAGGYIGVKALVASGHILKGSIFGLIQTQPLKKDANGQSNILVLGTSEDDPGHEASYLTDSIMILSVNQEKKTATMFSIPRDLVVQYGDAQCIQGSYGKINEYFNCVNPEDSETAEAERQTASRKFFGDIVGLDIQYSAHVNYTVMRDVVKALGTITVNIEGSNGAPGVMDSNFDWKCKGGNSYASRATMIKNCPPNGHFIDYPNGPAVLDAEHALYLAQARGDSAPTYGLGRSNFDREVNQQKILLAIREKALSTGTLTDIAKVTALIDALGNNLRTNLETSEVRTVMSLASDIQPESIQRLDLNKSGVFNDAGQPTAGQFNYSGLRSFIKKSLSADPVVREAASVAVYNASGVPGAAEKVAQQIEDAGLLRSEVTNSPVESAASYEIYVISKDKTASRAKLEQLYGTQAKETNPPFAVTGVNFVVIIGSNNNQ